MVIFLPPNTVQKLGSLQTAIFFHHLERQRKPQTCLLRTKVLALALLKIMLAVRPSGAEIDEPKVQAVPS
jgi:hypothetical protein